MKLPILNFIFPWIFLIDLNFGLCRSFVGDVTFPDELLMMWLFLFVKYFACDLEEEVFPALHEERVAEDEPGRVCSRFVEAIHVQLHVTKLVPA